MTVTAEERRQLLERYGRWFGEQRFAVAFTSTIEGEAAKKVTTNGWDKTQPLADGDFGASFVSGRGETRNPAIVLRPSNLIVLECDTEDDLLRIEALGLPATVTVRSSEPYKRHFYYRPDPQLDRIPYVAFRFESGKLTADSGRYFLAPPSIHPSGAVYAFLPGLGPDDVPIATLDEETYHQLAHSAAAETSEHRAHIHEDPAAKIRAGARNDTIFRAACAMRRWTANRGVIVQAMLAYNDAMCDPPLTRDRVEMQVDGAMKMRGGQDLQRELDRPPPPEEPWFPPDDEPHDLHVHFHAAPAEQAQRPASESVRRMDGATFVFAHAAEVPALWGADEEVLLAEGESLIIVGPDGVGKTTLVQQLLLSRIGVRGDLLGLPVTPAAGSVVYLAMDRPRQAQRSLRRMVDEDAADTLRERLAVWKGPLPINVLDRPAALADWISSEFPHASDVFVDSLKDLAPKLSDDEVGSRVNMARQELLARGIQVVELHHQRKEQRSEGKPKTLADVYGSRWITAGAGSVLLLWGEPGDLVVELIHLKQPAEPFGPCRVRHDHTAGTTNVFEAADLGAALEQTPSGMLVTDAAKVLYETSATPSADQREKARRRLEKLVAKGIAHRSDDPDGTARYYPRAKSSVTPRDPQRDPLTQDHTHHTNLGNKPHANHTHGHDPTQEASPPPYRGGVEKNVTPNVTPQDDPDEPIDEETSYLLEKYVTHHNPADDLPL